MYSVFDLPFIGSHIIGVEINNKELNFIEKDGGKYYMAPFYDDNCFIESITGDLTTLVDTSIIDVEETIIEQNKKYSITFITERGQVKVIWILK